jgi:hypothetical protein
VRGTTYFWAVDGIGIGWDVNTDCFQGFDTERWHSFCKELSVEKRENWIQFLEDAKSRGEMLFAQRIERWLPIIEKRSS